MQTDNKDVVLSSEECKLAFSWRQSFVFFLYCLSHYSSWSPRRSTHDALRATLLMYVMLGGQQTIIWHSIICWNVNSFPWWISFNAHLLVMSHSPTASHHPERHCRNLDNLGFLQSTPSFPQKHVQNKGGFIKQKKKEIVVPQRILQSGVHGKNIYNQ